MSRVRWSDLVDAPAPAKKVYTREEIAEILIQGSSHPDFDSAFEEPEPPRPIQEKELLTARLSKALKAHDKGDQTRRMYALRTRDMTRITSSPNKVIYFSCKREARKLRDILVKDYGIPTFVTPGPDHPDGSTQA